MVFTPKSNTRMGCWNVCSLGNPMKQSGRLCDILRTMREKSIEILALSEVRWPGHSMSELKEEAIVYSGMEASVKQHRCRGVAIVLSKKVAGAWRVVHSVWMLGRDPEGS